MKPLTLIVWISMAVAALVLGLLKSYFGLGIPILMLFSGLGAVCVILLCYPFARWAKKRQSSFSQKFLFFFRCMATASALGLCGASFFVLLESALNDSVSGLHALLFWGWTWVFLYFARKVVMGEKNEDLPG